MAKTTTARFRTIGGNVVICNVEDGIYGYGNWECQGCGESRSWAKRETANQHAATCRAE
jgi:hypothetical protein